MNLEEFIACCTGVEEPLGDDMKRNFRFLISFAMLHIYILKKTWKDIQLIRMLETLNARFKKKNEFWKQVEETLWSR